MKALICAFLLFFSGLGSWDESSLISAKQLNCLAKNIYHEARGEPYEGQLAVALVTLNRATSNSICETVYKYKQFSWTLKPKNITEYDAWMQSNEIAYHAILNKNKYTFKATHYHSVTVNPRWRLKKLKKIGKHIFYE